MNKQSYAQIKFDNSRKKLSSSLKDLEIAIKEKIEEITSEYLNIVDVKESLAQKGILSEIANNNTNEEEKNNLILENNNLLKRNIELEEEKNNLILENCNFDKKNNDLEEDIKKLNKNIEILTLQNKELAKKNELFFNKFKEIEEEFFQYKKNQELSTNVNQDLVYQNSILNDKINSLKNQASFIINNITTDILSIEEMLKRYDN